LKFYKAKYVGGQALPTDIHFFVKFRISKIHKFLDVKGIFLKLWIFTNFAMVFPVQLKNFQKGCYMAIKWAAKTGEGNNAGLGGGALRRDSHRCVD
jgi:hypothetical protein